MDDIRRKMSAAIAWSAIDRFGQLLAQFVIGILLARMLSPADFGLIGLVMIFAGVSYVLVDSGFGQALARTSHVDERYFGTVFCCNLLLSAALYLLFFFLAKPIASFFGQPMLCPLIRVLFLSLLFNAFYLVRHTRLGMELNYQPIALVNLSATLLGGFVGVAVALSGGGVWALVWQQVSYQAVRMVGFWIAGPKMRLAFSGKVVRELWPFSTNLLATGVLNALFGNLFLFVIGTIYPIKQAGYYTQAYKQSDTANFTFLSILGGSTYNLFAKLHPMRDTLLGAFRNIVQKSMPVCMPLTLALAVMAEPLAAVLFGDKWLPSVPYFQLLCLANLSAPLGLLCTNALNACGWSGTTFRIELIKKMLVAASVAIGIWAGIPAMLLSYVAACWIGTLLLMLGVRRKLKIYLRNQLHDLAPALGIALLLALLLWHIGQVVQPYGWRLATQTILGAGLYAALLFTLSRDTWQAISKGHFFLKG